MDRWKERESFGRNKGWDFPINDQKMSALTYKAHITDIYNLRLEKNTKKWYWGTEGTDSLILSWMLYRFPQLGFIEDRMNSSYQAGGIGTSMLFAATINEPHKRQCNAKTKCRKFETNIPRKGISGPQSQFPPSCVCERIIYFHDGSAFSAGGNMWTDPGNI